MNRKTVLTGGVVVLILFFIWYFFLKNVNINVMGDATLNWNPSAEEDLKGYRIYYGENPRTNDCPKGGYVEKIDVGKNTSYKVNNLENGKTYYFSVTSYNNGGKESCFSEEMHKTISINFFNKIKKTILRK